MHVPFDMQVHTTTQSLTRVHINIQIHIEIHIHIKQKANKNQKTLQNRNKNTWIAYKMKTKYMMNIFMKASPLMPSYIQSRRIVILT